MKRVRVMNERIAMIFKIRKIYTLYYNIRYRLIRKRVISLILYKGTKVKIYKSCDLNIEGKLFLGNPFTNKFYQGCKYTTLLNCNAGSNINIQGNVSFGPECRIVVEKEAELTIKGETYFSAENKILVYNRVIIGEKCNISWNVTIMDSNGKMIDNKNPHGEVKIGNKVWIGTNSIILKDTIIGDNCIIAANSVVKGVFPENCLIGGNPAKVLRKDVQWC
ncbi:acyltransferase [Clostridium paraputrificum]|uniref:acyltransferase n=1 Tax=Clostridium paraputrificum TaxID=29363 RepID=UPI000C06BBB8|nr:acyltransferase [Clostridium paraputrificum]